MRRKIQGSADPLELARQLRRELDAGPGTTGLDLARAHGLSPAVVSRLLAVLRMPGRLQRLVGRGLRLQTAGRINALSPAERNRVVRGLERGETLRSLLGESKPRVPRVPQRGSRKLRETFAARMREARLRARLTQAQLAAALALSQSTIGTWETAKALPEIVSLMRLADSLRVSIDWLLGRPSSAPSVPAPPRAVRSRVGALRKRRDPATG